MKKTITLVSLVAVVLAATAVLAAGREDEGQVQGQVHAG